LAAGEKPKVLDKIDAIVKPGEWSLFDNTQQSWMKHDLAEMRKLGDYRNDPFYNNDLK
jgi:hypothetical protein